jgi:hypothetical protein
MIIANPLYDTAFKKLIGDPEIASAVIETLLETKVVDIALTPTELSKTMTKEDQTLRFLRIDYSATIRDKNGEEQKILIEMQKAKSADDVLRFRKYLAIAGYLPKSDNETPIPVVTIYFLGFKLQHVETPCLKVSRQYIDMLNNTVLETKEKFVELLTHDSYIIQAERINVDKKVRTKLENILSVFEQKNVVKGQKGIIDYIYPIDDSTVKKMVDVLHYISTNPEERQELDNDMDWESHEYHTTGKVVRLQDELAEKDRTIAEKDRELTDAKQQAENAKRIFVLNMHNEGLSIETIVKVSKLTETEVNNILETETDNTKS